MDPSRSRGRITAGVIALAGLVCAFSMSSTLVKRAHAPGVLVAFWRMVMVSAIWNASLWWRGRRVRFAEVRQAFVPGVFLGLNLALFFAGATHNSVANAALIGSMSPFFIVPIGHRWFGEHLDPRALVFALVAFAGLVAVLLQAPAAGDASTRGNVFGIGARALWVAYLTATRQVAVRMDVGSYLATVSAVAAVAVLPLALAKGDVFAMGRTGWTYTMVLAFLIGVGGHGLMLVAQRSIAIGTIGIVSVAEPALAVLWSFLLLGEHVNLGQAVGMAVVCAGLLAFLVLNRRTARVAAPVTAPG